MCRHEEFLIVNGILGIDIKARTHRTALRVAGTRARKMRVAWQQQANDARITLAQRAERTCALVYEIRVSAFARATFESLDATCACLPTY